MSPKLLPFQSFLLIRSPERGNKLITTAEYYIESRTEKKRGKSGVLGKNLVPLIWGKVGDEAFGRKGWRELQIHRFSFSDTFIFPLGT